MKRKKPQARPDPQVERSVGSTEKIPSEAALKRTKLSLESLLAETPENSRDEIWEKMASVGKEFH